MSTLVVYADTTDGFISSGDVEWNDGEGWISGYYPSARDGTGNDFLSDTTDNIVYVGQRRSPTPHAGYDFFVYESFLAFDTSSVGSGSTVSAAVLNLTCNTSSSASSFTCETRMYDWGANLTTADYISGASLTQTLVASVDTGSLADGAHVDFTDVALPANINKTGSTRLVINSSKTRLNTAPTAAESPTFFSSDYAGTTSDPKLTVTYTAGSPPGFLMLEDNSGSYELEDGSGGTKLEN